MSYTKHDKSHKTYSQTGCGDSILGELLECGSKIGLVSDLPVACTLDRSAVHHFEENKQRTAMSPYPVQIQSDCIHI